MDLNCDLGEGYGRWSLGDDVALLDVVTSANVACGFHAGDPATIGRAVAAAAERGVTVGAQVSYPDLVGFGRRAMDVSPDDLRADVLYQVGALEAFCRVAGTAVRYVKPHGALWHRVATDGEQAGALLDAVRDYDPTLTVLVAPRSVVARLAAGRGQPVVAEGFVDRGYAPDGTLLPRSSAGALLADREAAVAQALDLAAGSVAVADGSRVPLTVGSLCLHGDTPGAVDLGRAVRAALTAAGVDVAPFA